MKKLFLALIILLLLSACTNQTIPGGSDNPSSPNPPDNSVTPSLDAAVELTPAELDAYKDRFYGDFYSYSAPILTPYTYTYKGAEKDIEKIANILGEMYIEDMKKEREGQSFTITNVYEYSSHVYNATELKDWLTGPLMADKNLVIADDQWICDYTCKFDYTGNLSVRGAQHPGSFGDFSIDGSGEYYHWIIQKTGDNTYIMRGLSVLMNISELLTT